MAEAEETPLRSLFADILVEAGIDHVFGMPVPAWLAWAQIPAWGVFLQPLGFILVLTCIMAENKRPPFDAPEGESDAADAGVDLMLNGHTHGGQIWPFNFLVKRAYPHIAGTYAVGEMTQVVSRGAGQWGPPMRLFAPAEIVVITLRSPDLSKWRSSEVEK